MLYTKTRLFNSYLIKMPDPKLVEVKTTTRLTQKIGLLFLLLTVGVVFGSFFLAILVINSTILARQ